MSRPFVKVVFPPTDGSGTPRTGSGTKIFSVIDGVEYLIPAITKCVVTNPAGSMKLLTLEIMDFEIEQPKK